MANTKPQVKIVNCTTGEEIVRDATADEIAQIKLDAIDNKNQQEQFKAEAQAKAIAKAAILDRIGLTADELKTILG
jgi:uncharacterized protein YhdP